MVLSTATRKIIFLVKNPFMTQSFYLMWVLLKNHLLIQIWMSTNKKAVFWNLDWFLRADMPLKKGDPLAKHFFNWDLLLFAILCHFVIIVRGVILHKRQGKNRWHTQIFRYINLISIRGRQIVSPKKFHGCYSLDFFLKCKRIIIKITWWGLHSFTVHDWIF